MMTFKSLRQSVHRGFLKVPFDKEDQEEGKIHKLIASAIVFKLVRDIIGKNPALTSDITSTIESYAGTYKTIIESMQSKYVVYRTLYNTVREYHLSSFLTITEEQINRINKIYEDKTEVRLFEKESFSQYMYKVSHTTIGQLERLRKIHYEIIVPIVDYYIERFNLSYSAMVVDNAEAVANNPGKEISFTITGIPVASIVRDVKQDKMKVSKYIYDIHTNDDKVVLIIK